MSTGPRRVMALLGFVAGVTLLGVSLRALPDGRGIPRESSVVAEARGIAARPLFREAEEGREGPRVLLVGDSMLIPAPDRERRLRSVLTELERLLEAEGPPEATPIGLVPLVLPGLGISDQYALADVILAARPDVVAIELNAIGFQANGGGQWTRTAYVGWIEPRRLLEALLLPLHGRTVTADQLLWRVGLVQAGLDGVWAGLVAEQGRLTVVRRAWMRDVDDALGSRVQRWAFQAARVEYVNRLLSGADRSRPSEREIERSYAAALAGVGPEHPLLRVLGALVADYREAGVESLVYATPINVDYIESIGRWNARGFASSMEATRQVVEAAGGRFVDLHDLLPDAGFRDSRGHLSVDGPTSGVASVARALAAPVREAIARRESATGAR